MSARLQRWVEGVLNAPGVRAMRAARFERAFAAGQFSGVCRGIYDSYAAAAAAAPRGHAIGYDHDAAGALYAERLDRIYPGDYPAMFWLARAFARGARHVFDLGGHVGIAYYGYQRYLALPSPVQWQVLDTPAVARAGRAIALTRDLQRALTFVDDMADAASADVLFTAGCLQYLEDTLAQRITALPVRPPLVLINLVPMHPERAYWTVQSVEQAFCPYHVQHDATFFAEMAALGYELIDRWENAEKRCIVRFEPAYSFTGYVGAVFQHRDARLRLPSPATRAVDRGAPVATGRHDAVSRD
jgi:putative methyltransferase (TIGR04325 family)